MINPVACCHSGTCLGEKFKVLLDVFSCCSRWEDARAMMMNESFLQRLIFYDKDNIPEDIFEALKDYVNHPQFQVKGWGWGGCSYFSRFAFIFFLIIFVYDNGGFL